MSALADVGIKGEGSLTDGVFYTHTEKNTSGQINPSSGFSQQVNTDRREKPYAVRSHVGIEFVADLFQKCWCQLVLGVGYLDYRRVKLGKVAIVYWR